MTERISIHALREEGDAEAPKTCTDDGAHFYPRPPRGGRHFVIPINFRTSPEISIHALREEGDLEIGDQVTTIGISIHALREEGDSKNRDKISIFL